jgi:hypothetical protein
MFITFVGLTLLLALAPATETFADSTPRPLPIASNSANASHSPPPYHPGPHSPKREGSSARKVEFSSELESFDVNAVRDAQ